MEQIFVNENTEAVIAISEWLQKQLMLRCRKNPKYSLRALASLLDMHAATLSKILSGQRGVSIKQAEKICETLAAAPEEREAILRGIAVKTHSKFLKNAELIPSNRQLSLDAFSAISEWYHYALLELTTVRGFEAKPSWVARSLGISVAESKLAIERLKRLQLLVEKDGAWVKSEKHLTNEFIKGATSAAHKSLQRAILQMALEAIEITPQDEKDITSITMAIDESKLADAREIIRKFRDQLCQYLEDGTPTRVYHLGVQLYPASKILEKKN